MRGFKVMAPEPLMPRLRRAHAQRLILRSSAQTPVGIRSSLDADANLVCRMPRVLVLEARQLSTELATDRVGLIILLDKVLCKRHR